MPSTVELHGPVIVNLNRQFEIWSHLADRSLGVSARGLSLLC